MLLTIVPPMPGAERRFKPFVDFVHAAGWETEFVRLEWSGRVPPFGSTEIFPQVDAQTVGKVVMGFSLGALYAHLGALHARHLILGSISPFFLEDDDEPERWMVSYRAGNADTPADILVGAEEDAQMHRRAEAIRDFTARPPILWSLPPNTNSGTRTTCRRSKRPWTASRPSQRS